MQWYPVSAERLLVVDLEVRCPNEKRLAAAGVHIPQPGGASLQRDVFARAPEDVPEGSGDDACMLPALGWTHHGVSLAGASLAIGEDRAVISVHDTSTASFSLLARSVSK